MSTQNPFFSFFTTHPGGTPLNNPDTTQSKGIEIGADGPPGDPLEITDTHGGTLKVLTPRGSVFNQSGRYLHQELNMLDGVHTFGLRANSSSLPSHEWGLTVSAAESLKIVSIKGLISGKEILEGTNTTETLFAMSGKARANSTCYLRIDGVRQPGLIAVDANGDWAYNTSTQASGRRSYEIEGNYDSGPISTPPRTLIVEAEAPVNIDRVTGVQSGTDIPHGYPTNESAVNLVGTATPQANIQLFHNNVAGPTTTAVGGNWSFSNRSIQVGSNTFFVRDVNTGRDSNTRSLTKSNPLSFGSNRTLTTTNYHVAQNRPPANPNASATYTQPATGGSGGYTYSSNNTAVAVIDSNTGRVRAVGNGQAVLTAKDSLGAQASHTVTVSGVIIYYQHPNWGADIFQNAALDVSSVNGQLPLRAEIRALYDTYRPEGQPDVVLGWLQGYPTWTREPYSLVNHYYTLYLANGQESYAQIWQARCAVVARLN